VHQVFYAGTSLVTGDEIAFAVMDLVSRLSGRPEVIEIPCRPSEVSGHDIEVVRVLVSPSAPMVARRVNDSRPEIEDRAVVDRLRGRTDEVESESSSGQFVSESASTYDFNEWF
jgi:hypothetical protein